MAAGAAAAFTSIPSKVCFQVMNTSYKRYSKHGFMCRVDLATRHVARSHIGTRFRHLATVTAFIVLSSGYARAQNPVREVSLRAQLAFLADDLLEGRGTGQRGGELTVRYLETQNTALKRADELIEAYLSNQLSDTGGPTHTATPGPH